MRRVSATPALSHACSVPAFIPASSALPPRPTSRRSSCTKGRSGRSATVTSKARGYQSRALPSLGAESACRQGSNGDPRGLTLRGWRQISVLLRGHPHEYVGNVETMRQARALERCPRGWGVRVATGSPEPVRRSRPAPASSSAAESGRARPSAAPTWPLVGARWRTAPSPPAPAARALPNPRTAATPRRRRSTLPRCARALQTNRPC